MHITPQVEALLIFAFVAILVVVVVQARMIMKLEKENKDLNEGICQSPLTIQRHSAPVIRLKQERKYPLSRFDNMPASAHEFIIKEMHQQLGIQMFEQKLAFLEIITEPPADLMNQNYKDGPYRRYTLSCSVVRPTMEYAAAYFGEQNFSTNKNKRNEK